MRGIYTSSNHEPEKARTATDHCLPAQTSTCDKTIATRVCKNVKLDLCPNGVCKDQRTEHTLCTTPCAKYLTANMYACSVGITKDAIGTPDTELYLASVSLPVLSAPSTPHSHRGCTSACMLEKSRAALVLNRHPRWRKGR